jgi:hypothetical protein
MRATPTVTLLGATAGTAVGDLQATGFAVTVAAPADNTLYSYNGFTASAEI